MDSGHATLETFSWRRWSWGPTCRWACHQTNHLLRGQFEFRRSARERGLSARAPGGLLFLWIWCGAFQFRYAALAKATFLLALWLALWLRKRLHLYQLQRTASGLGESLFADALVFVNALGETQASPQVYCCWFSAGTTPARNTVKTRSSWRRRILNTTLSPAFSFLTAAR
jgi:hypothetical protein